MDVASKLSAVETETPPHWSLPENAKVKKRRRLVNLNFIVVLYVDIIKDI
jgi:hypothetical protein